MNAACRTACASSRRAGSLRRPNVRNQLNWALPNALGLYMAYGSHTSVGRPGSTPENRASATPTIWNGLSSSTNPRPTMAGSRPNRRVQNAWLMIATGWAPGCRSSELASRRPADALTPRSPKASPETNCVRTGSFSPPPKITGRITWVLIAKRLDVTAGDVAQAHEQRVVEGLRLRPPRAVVGERHIDQLFRLAHRKGPQDQRIDQRERRDAGAQRQRERHQRGGCDARILAQHPQTMADVATDRLNPWQQRHHGPRVLLRGRRRRS